ncbi:MAG: amidohydrolase family protein [Anaerolineaceae bacterium]
MQGRISFSGATIVAGDDFQLLSKASLNVVNGRIVSIGDPIADAVQISFESGLICPMFVNAHSHLGDTGAKELGIGIPMEMLVSPPNGLKHQFLSKLSRDEHISQMRHGIIEMLSNGIIACGDFREQGMEGVIRLKEAVKGLPLKVKILGRFSETSDPKTMLQEAIELLDSADGLGIRDVDSYPISLIQRLRRDFPEKLFAIHVAENYQVEQKSILEYGCGQAKRSLEMEPDILIHLTHTSTNELLEINSANIHAVSCPRTNSILGDGLPDLKNWIDAGIEFGLGTDNMMASSPDMFREMEYTSRLIRGMNRDAGSIDSRKVLLSATLQGARTLKLEKDLGSLSPGKFASFIVLNTQDKNLRYCQDMFSAIVNRAGVQDINSIYIEGEKYK